jgi:hypothetical protein
MVRCSGQSVSRYNNQPTGVLCFAVYAGAVESARVLGWRFGEPDADGERPAMCPACARPGSDEESSGRVANLEPLPGL